MKFFPIFLLFTISIFPQHIGFSIDGTDMITNKTARISPSGFSAVAGFTIIDDFKVELRTGFSAIPTEFTGWNIAGHLIYIINDPFYAAAGVFHHSNSGYSSISSGVATIDITMMSIGAGVDIAEYLSFETFYNTNFNKEPWIFNRNPDLSYNVEKLVSVIRFSLKYYWEM